MDLPTGPEQPTGGHRGQPLAGPPAGTVTVRYWASLRAAAGRAEDLIPVAGNTTLASLKMTVLSRHRNSPQFGRLLSTCSVLLGETPVNTGDPEATVVAAGDVVEFLPPFAGG